MGFSGVEAEIASKKIIHIDWDFPGSLPDHLETAYNETGDIEWMKDPMERHKYIEHVITSGGVKMDGPNGTKVLRMLPEMKTQSFDMLMECTKFPGMINI